MFLLLVSRSMSDPLVSTLLLCTSLLGESYSLRVVLQGRLTCARSNYIVSSPVISYLYTQMIGDPKNMPTITASANFAGIAIIGMHFA